MAQKILVLLVLHAVCSIFQVSAQIAIPTKPAQCIVKQADIAFIIDASGSVANTEWKQSLDFASSIVRGYDIGPDKVRVALIVFSNTAQIVFDFDQYTTKDQVIKAIAAAPKESLSTYTNKALDIARTQLFTVGSGMRPKVPNILMVLTDGQSTQRADTVTAARNLHQTGMTVVAVGVKGADATELKQIASAPKLVYNYGDYNKLIALQSTFSADLCAVAASLAPPTTPPPPPPKPTTPKGCVVKTADIAFIVDASGSVDQTEWQQSLVFAQNIVKGYDIGKNQVRVALIEFSGGASIQFDFNKHSTKAAVIQGIQNAKKSGGGTRTDLALNLAKSSLFTAASGMRAGVPNILFVITDGASNNAGLTKTSAKALHAMGLTVFAVGVGGANAAELANIASDPSLVYNYKDFNKLAQIQSIFNQKACAVVASVAPKPTKPKPNSGCSIYSADVVFVVDTSTSVGEANFNLTKTFLSNMMLQLDFVKNRVGVIQFNDKPKTVFELNQNNNKRDAQLSVSRMVYDKGPATRIAGALKYMREHSFSAANGDRPNVANLAILLTDGQSKEPYRTQYEGNLTKTAGVEIFAVGVGSDINNAELEALASSKNFVHLVQSYQQLAGIQSLLAGKLCQGFTVPAQVTRAPCNCVDLEKDCRGYGDEICYEAKYRTFAKDKCASYCDLCEPGCKRILPNPVPCKDKLTDCIRRVDVCTPQYKGYAMQNCAKFCNYCHLLNKAPIYQTTQKPRPTPKATLPPIVKTTPPPAPTKYVICDPNCHDVKRDCKDYDHGNCKKKEYEHFFKSNCAEYCGYCTPIPQCVTTPGPCIDKIDCSAYADSSCVDYPRWADENCRRRCGLCSDQTPVTVLPTSSPVCEDKEDCTGYGQDVCTDYPDFSKINCMVFCKICTPTHPVTTPKCADKRDCRNYDKAVCTNPDYRLFMIRECRLYCNLCNEEH